MTRNYVKCPFCGSIVFTVKMLRTYRHVVVVRHGETTINNTNDETIDTVLSIICNRCQRMIPTSLADNILNDKPFSLMQEIAIFACNINKSLKNIQIKSIGDI